MSAHTHFHGRLRALNYSLSDRATPVASSNGDANGETRILIINPSGAELRGTLGQGLEASRCDCTEVTTRAAVELLVSPSIHGIPSVSSTVDEVLDAYPTPVAALAVWDGLVVLGSPFSARNWEHPRAKGVGGDVGPAADIDAMLELICAFHSTGRPVLGICLGSQLVARAFGGRVYKMPLDCHHTALPPCCAIAAAWDDDENSDLDQRKRGVEFGFLPQIFSREALADPLVGPALESMGVPERERQWRFQLWHEDSFELPDGAVVLSQRPVLQGAEALGGGGVQVRLDTDDQRALLPRSLHSKMYAKIDSGIAPQYHWEVGRIIASQWWNEFAVGLHASRGSAWLGALASGLAEHNAHGHVEAAERFAHTMTLRWVELCAQRRRQRARAKSI